ncbi:MAG: tetratricopeptide repeat protein [Polyangiaceae bacterium]
MAEFESLDLDDDLPPTVEVPTMTDVRMPSDAPPTVKGEEVVGGAVTVRPPAPGSVPPIALRSSPPPSRVSVAPSSATKPPGASDDEGTTPPDAMTSPPDAMTSPPDAMTSPPDAMTSPPDAMTSPPVAPTRPPDSANGASTRPPSPPSFRPEEPTGRGEVVGEPIDDDSPSSLPILEPLAEDQVGLGGEPDQDYIGDPLAAFDAEFGSSVEGFTPSGADAVRPPSASQPDEGSLDSDLPGDVQTMVLEVYGSLESTNIFELLGIPRDVDRKTLRTAYFSLVSKFHPDRYFGKRLGPYRVRMEQILAFATTHYNSLLATLPRGKSGEHQGAAKADVVRPPSAAEASIPPNVPRARRRRASGPTLGPDGGPTRSNLGRYSQADKSPGTKISAEEERARREALARRLRGLGGANARSKTTGAEAKPATEPGKTAAAARADARSAAKAVATAKATAATAAQGPQPGAPDPFARQRHQKAQSAKAHYEAGNVAAENGDFATASREYKMSLAIAEDPVVRRAFDDVDKKARTQTAEDSWKKGVAAERAQQLDDAILHYAKAFDAVPSATVAARAATMLHKSGKDIKRATRFAEQAVQLEPQTTAHRVMLAQIYLDAGLRRRAEGELERALQIDPKDAAAKKLLRSMSSIL